MRITSARDLALATNAIEGRFLGAADLGIVGNADANRLVGNAGANVLDGGAGNDALVGGVDMFVIRPEMEAAAFSTSRPRALTMTDSTWSASDWPAQTRCLNPSAALPPVSSSSLPTARR
jgi:hypothetical protein